MPTGIYSKESYRQGGITRRAIWDQDITKHPRWKGGKPKCLDCGKQLTTYYRKRCKPCWGLSVRGDKNHGWKGDKVKYRGLHAWVTKNKGKAKECLKCGSTNIVDWANVSGLYKRDLDDFMPLCRTCHKNFDLGRRHTYAPK